MAKLIVSNIVSLNGFIAGPGGNPAVLPMDQAFEAYNPDPGGGTPLRGIAEHSAAVGLRGEPVMTGPRERA